MRRSVPQLMIISDQLVSILPSKSESHDPNNVKNSLMEYLKYQSQWLLIFDNLHINENDKIKDITDWNHGSVEDP